MPVNAAEGFVAPFIKVQAEGLAWVLVIVNFILAHNKLHKRQNSVNSKKKYLVYYILRENIMSIKKCLFFKRHFFV